VAVGAAMAVGAGGAAGVGDGERAGVGGAATVLAAAGSGAADRGVDEPSRLALLERLTGGGVGETAGEWAAVGDAEASRGGSSAGAGGDILPGAGDLDEECLGEGPRGDADVGGVAVVWRVGAANVVDAPFARGRTVASLSVAGPGVNRGLLFAWAWDLFRWLGEESDGPAKDF